MTTTELPKCIPFNSDKMKSILSSVTDHQLKIAGPDQQIMKDECILSCDTPSSPYGLFINLTTFGSVGWDFLPLDSTRTASPLYLQIRKIWKSKILAESLQPPSGVPTKLAIGVEGGVASLQELGCSETLARSIKAVVDHSSSATAKRDSTWEEDIKESPFSNTLVQLANPSTIPHSGWKCAKCGNTKNLWMHLSDGYIGCGRKLYGVVDSGCLTGEEGAAVLHWEENRPARPLAVKLGTITPSSADVYSYAEDTMVVDSKLAEHLAHFGINIQKAEKTEKTLTEMQIDYNKNFDWNRISESDVDLQILKGQGHIGLKNFGNTCYINSCIQLLSRVVQLTHNLTAVYPGLIAALPQTSRPSEDLLIQFSKVLVGLSSDRYPEQRKQILMAMDEENRKLFEQEYPNDFIAPLLLRLTATGKHVEFSTSRQQDAEEFLRYFLEQLENTIKTNSSIQHLLPGSSTLVSDLFGFEIEEKLRHVGSSKVRLTSVDERILSLPLPSPHSDGPQPKKARSDALESEPLGSFEDSLTEWANGETIQLMKSVGVTRQVVSAQKTRKMKTFPPYLLVQLKRFYLGSDWTAKKIVSPVEMPEEINLSSFRGSGLSPDETEWQDDEAIPDVNQNVISNIENMGFSRNAALRAIRACGSTAPPEVYVDWVVSNMDDPELNNPIPSDDKNEIRRTSSPELVELGFSPLQIEAALLSNGGDTALAIEWIFSVGAQASEDELRKIIDSHAPPRSAEDQLKLVDVDGKGQYSLVGIISHMGSNAGNGHYVCHVRETDANGNPIWVLFNDTKVAKSQHPPLNFGYLYLYRRST